MGKVTIIVQAKGLSTSTLDTPIEEKLQMAFHSGARDPDKVEVYVVSDDDEYPDLS